MKQKYLVFWGTLLATIISGAVKIYEINKPETSTSTNSQKKESTDKEPNLYSNVIKENENCVNDFCFNFINGCKYKGNGEVRCNLKVKNNSELEEKRRLYFNYRSAVGVVLHDTDGRQYFESGLEFGGNLDERLVQLPKGASTILDIQFNNFPKNNQIEKLVLGGSGDPGEIEITCFIKENKCKG